ncbi:MAG: pantoate--beta-alanine ligase [Candidatus Dormibacteria bacterium]
MRIVEQVAELQAASREWRRAGEAIGFVPTMGALHQGHLSLVRAAQAGGSRVIVSIFVNPLQFGPTEDLAAYPRPFDADREMLEREGVDILFHPSMGEMYPDGSATRVLPGPLADRLEGDRRRGHFIGVATVVARLFGAACADRAYFGQKDAQQVAVVRGMARDLAIPVEVVACPTVRETDGLAMSSRNGYLDAREREQALVIVQALAAVQALAGERAPVGELESAMNSVLAGADGVTADYAVVVDCRTFLPVEVADEFSLALVAARVGRARLIDNAAVLAADVLPFRIATTPGLPEVKNWNA